MVCIRVVLLETCERVDRPRLGPSGGRSRRDCRICRASLKQEKDKAGL